MTLVPDRASHTDIEVRIADVPVDLHLESHAQLQQAVKELWIALAGASRHATMTRDDAADIEDLIRSYKPQSEAAARQARAALDRGEASCTLELRYPASAAHDAPRLTEYLEQVDRLREQELYSPTAPPEVIAYRRWLAAEISRQVDA